MHLSYLINFSDMVEINIANELFMLEATNNIVHWRYFQISYLLFTVGYYSLAVTLKRPERSHTCIT